jgi:YHS domain-containing protein
MGGFHRKERRILQEINGPEFRMKPLNLVLGIGSLFLIGCTPSTPRPTTPPPQPTAQAVDPKPINTRCPVTGDPIDPKITLVYDGKTYAFCCEDCVKMFQKDPAKYAADVK